MLSELAQWGRTTELQMTEQKSTNPTQSFSQSRIAAMKNVLAEGRLTQRAPTDQICTPRLAGRGEWGWSEGAPGQYRPGHPSPLTPHLHNLCPICLPFLLLSILSSIILWLTPCARARVFVLLVSAFGVDQKFLNNPQSSQAFLFSSNHRYSNCVEQRV